MRLAEELPAPTVIDADGLYALGGHTDALKRARSVRLLTPHPGEMARLVGDSISAVQSDRAGVAVRFAAEHRVLLALKGAGTVVTDGDRLYVNPTGNPGMATGGTGDVLTGLTAGCSARAWRRSRRCSSPSSSTASPGTWRRAGSASYR